MRAPRLGRKSWLRTRGVLRGQTFHAANVDFHSASMRFRRDASAYRDDRPISSRRSIRHHRRRTARFSRAFPHSGDPMLAIRSLSKTYANGVKALDDVSLDIPRGMFGLLGPNGAGKSSLMRTLATLQEADMGTVTLDGPDGLPIDVLRDKDAVRRQLGYL